MKKECKFIDGFEVISVTQNHNGDWYVVLKVPNVLRGIKGKTKSKVDEVLIIGIPKSKFNLWCEKHGVYVERIED